MLWTRGCCASKCVEPMLRKHEVLLLHSWGGVLGNQACDVVNPWAWLLVGPLNVRENERKGIRILNHVPIT